MNQGRTNPPHQQSVEHADTRVQQAIDELRELVHRRYPTARFEISRGEDDPASIHLLTEVDVDDPDDVLDLVIDRVVDLQVNEHLPIHVIPLRTPERVLAALQMPAKGHRRRTRAVPLLDKRQLLGQ